MSTRRIFICYRRRHAKSIAHQLARDLSERFGSGAVFIDSGALAAGSSFIDDISRAIRFAPVTLVVVDRSWNTFAGRLRLSRPWDPVHIEIATALRQTSKVIPILYDGASMPKARRLPAELRGLATRNGWPVSDATYQTDMAALIAEVAREVHAMNPAAWPDASEAGHLPCVRCPKRSLAAVEASAFAAIQRFAMNPYGYDVEEVNAGLVGMLGRMSDPERCIGLRSPYFRWSSRSGYDREQVNTFLEKHRLPPVRFEQGVRRILADHGVLLSLFPAAVEHAQLAHPQLGTDEELLGLIVLRSHRTMPEMLAFTNTSIIGLLRTMRFQVQYQDMADLVVAARRWDEPLGANEFTGIPTYSELKVTYRGSSTTLPREELKWVGGVDALAEAVVSDLRGLLQRFGGQTEGAEMDLTTMSLRRRPSR